jgi:hypothetical protein
MAKKQNIALWQEFYKVAEQFRNMAPWRWMYDSDLFGVENPETGEIGWCSIMGNAGEHFALGVYKGVAGFQSFWGLADLGDEGINMLNPEHLNVAFGQLCWMISFEDAYMVYPQNKKHLKELRITFRGKGQWVTATSNDPGFHPWPLDEKDLPFLILCLQQAMNVAIRAEDKPDLLDEERWLVRKPTKKGAELEWEDTYLEDEDIPEAECTPIEPSEQFIKKINGMKRVEGAMMLGTFLLRHDVQESPNERPWNPFLMVSLQYGSGYIVTQDMIRYSDLEKSLEPFLLNLFETIGVVTSQLGYHHPPVGQLLKKICQKANIDLFYVPGEEPTFRDLLESMAQFNQ